MQPVGVQDHFSQKMLKFGFGDGKNAYMKKGGGGQSHFYRSPGIWICGWEIFVRLKRCTARYLGYVNLTRDFFQIRV